MQTNSTPAQDGMPWATTELAPDLPLRVYTSMERWHGDRIHALALYCSDGRWGDAFDEFCQKHLLIPRYDRWAVPGGPAWLTAADHHPLGKAAREQLDFLVQVHELERIVLITHYGCAYYSQRLKQSPRESLAAQNADIRTAIATLKSWYPAMRLDAFLAMRSGSMLSFHELS